MPDEESSRPEESAAPGKRPRARRSRRGGRGRGRKPIAGAGAQPDIEPPAAEAEFAATGERMETAEPAAEEMPIADSSIEEVRHETADELVREESEALEEAPVPGEAEPTSEEPPPLQRPPERSDFRPASPAAIADAIAEVNQVITSLKQVLDQMEEVLETLELAEVQKSADEREIQSLRNALRQFERRGGAGEPRHEHGGHSHPQQRQDSRRGRHR